MYKNMSSDIIVHLQSGIWGHGPVDAATCPEGHYIICRGAFGCRCGELARPKCWSRDCDGFGLVAIDNHGESVHTSGGYAIIIPVAQPTNLVLLTFSQYIVLLAFNDDGSLSPRCSHCVHI